MSGVSARGAISCWYCKNASVIVYEEGSEHSTYRHCANGIYYCSYLTRIIGCS
jgi:hypothetical protein